MRMYWKKGIMIMLMGLLVGGAIVPPHAVADERGDKVNAALTAAQAAEDKATKAYNETMSTMTMMKKMPMTANEKEMMKMMGQMADTINNLMGVNKQLIEAIKQLKEMQGGEKK
jgi:hypothetical protein